MPVDRSVIRDAHRVVVKVGSSSLTDPGGGLDGYRLQALANLLAKKVLGGTQVVLVSSGAIAAGIHDRGLETLAADSLRVKERRTVYTHPATGAQTRIFTIARRDRNLDLLARSTLLGPEMWDRDAEVPAHDPDLLWGIVESTGVSGRFQSLPLRTRASLSSRRT